MSYEFFALLDETRKCVSSLDEMCQLKLQESQLQQDKLNELKVELDKLNAKITNREKLSVKDTTYYGDLGWLTALSWAAISSASSTSMPR